jgi:hypothetical protein
MGFMAFKLIAIETYAESGKGELLTPPPHTTILKGQNLMTAKPSLDNLWGFQENRF